MYEVHRHSRILADKLYRSRTNLFYFKEFDIRLFDPAQGKSKKDKIAYMKREYENSCDSVEVRW